MTEDEMVGWHHRLKGHEFEQALGDGEAQGSLAYCSPWGHKELDTFTFNSQCCVSFCCPVQFSCSVVSDSLDPVDCSTPGLPVHHQLPEFTQTHVH